MIDLAKLTIILPDDEICAAIVREAKLAVGIVEDPPGSNRNAEIDAMCEEFGVPLGSPWCALLAARTWKRAGADIPPVDDAKGWHPAKAETWHEWALATGRFSSLPIRGCAVLYGDRHTGHASHIAVAVITQVPILLDIEGNTSLTGFSREGILSEVKPVNMDRLLGYVHPHPTPTPGVDPILPTL